jgi:hypothetical protein
MAEVDSTRKIASEDFAHPQLLPEMIKLERQLWQNANAQIGLPARRMSLGLGRDLAGE